MTESAICAGFSITTISRDTELMEVANDEDIKEIFIEKDLEAKEDKEEVIKVEYIYIY